jgi:rhodanese-related sulfurtransferase
MIKIIKRDELMRMVSSGEKFKLVDVLDKGHYEKEHIKGAISLPLDEIEKKAGRMLKKDETIVVYCASFDCQASTKAAEKLLSMGYKNVLDYKGGLKDYKETGLPLEGSLYERKVRCPSC